ncbi:hypothetical protein GQ457_10G013670 [Hibiscus cannabinus]
MCFTAPPTSPDCMVFGIDDDYPIRCQWRHCSYLELTARFYTMVLSTAPTLMENRVSMILPKEIEESIVGRYLTN